jgi:cytochrome bd-type quinol oxidase subunit 2
MLHYSIMIMIIIIMIIISLILKYFILEWKTLHKQTNKNLLEIIIEIIFPRPAFADDH